MSHSTPDARYRSTPRWTLLLRTMLLLVAIVAATPAWAAGGRPEGQSRPDFRFAAPRGSFGLRAGWTFERGDGEIFQFLSDQLTLQRSDFNAPTLAADVSWRLGSHVDAIVGIEYSHRSKRSEFRDYVDENDIPIVQDSRLTQVPVTFGLKLYLSRRGRSVGQYAWVPATVVPYVGGGAGFTWYRLEQEGEFVDFTDLTIFSDLFRSDGWTLAAHAFGGVEIKLNPSLRLVLEGRYQWADAELKGSFVGFDPIDLNGSRITAGVAWKF